MAPSQSSNVNAVASVVVVDTVEQLVSTFLGYGTGWCFRGVSDSNYTLQPSLERFLKPYGHKRELVREVEALLMKQFRSRAHHYVSDEALPTGTLGWLSLMQHHGVPTRLLDFSLSPFIALFFALDNVEPDSDLTQSIWCVDFSNLMSYSELILSRQDESIGQRYGRLSDNAEKVFDEYLYTRSHDVLWFTEPERMNLRLERQKGTFLMSCSFEKTIDSLLRELSEKQSGLFVRKLDLPPHLRQSLRDLLRKVGLESSRVYPGLDGLARDVKLEIQLSLTRLASDYQRRVIA